MLDETLRAAKGLEYDDLMKHSKTEEGGCAPTFKADFRRSGLRHCSTLVLPDHAPHHPDMLPQSPPPCMPPTPSEPPNPPFLLPLISAFEWLTTQPMDQKRTLARPRHPLDMHPDPHMTRPSLPLTSLHTLHPILLFGFDRFLEPIEIYFLLKDCHTEVGFNISSLQKRMLTSATSQAFLILCPGGRKLESEVTAAKLKVLQVGLHGTAREMARGTA